MSFSVNTANGGAGGTAETEASWDLRVSPEPMEVTGQLAATQIIHPAVRDVRDVRDVREGQIQIPRGTSTFPADIAGLKR